MNTLKYTLIADGSSDKTLLRIIKWTLDDLYPTLATEQNFADFRQLPNPPKTIEQKVKSAKYYFPYQLLFIHRDAEKNDNKTVDLRKGQIKKEIGDKEFENTVCIVPVKMMETWLLINETAIKQAAGNRSYDKPVILPKLKSLDKESNPKALLHSLLKQASGLKGRKLSSFNPNYAVHLVADYIDDFSPLRQLQAFRIFESDIKEKIDKLLLQK